jgi:hypothetical protein
MAEKLSKAVGREIQYVDVPEKAMMGALLSVGLPPWQVDGLIEDYAHYRRGEAASIASGVQDATGTAARPLMTLHAATRKHLVSLRLKRALVRHKLLTWRSHCYHRIKI